MKYPVMVVLTALCCAGVAQAQWNDDAKQCFEISGNADLQIKHCTSAIASGQLSPPNTAVTLNNRAAAWMIKGDLPHALEDYDAAIKFDAKLTSAYVGRGQVNFSQSRFDLAATDFEQAQGLEADAYTTIWLFLARARSGKDGSAELARNAKLIKGDKWPFPLLSLLSGSAKPDATLAKARNANANAERAQLCEANFYIGEWFILSKNTTEAKKSLKQAATQCPQTFVEYVAATSELKRLK